MRILIIVQLIDMLDKAPRLSISNIIWILSSDTICQLNQLFWNSEAEMLSIKEMSMDMDTVCLYQQSGGASSLKTEAYRIYSDQGNQFKNTLYMVFDSLIVQVSAQIYVSRRTL